MAEEKAKSGSQEAAIKAAGAEAKSLLEAFFKNVNEQKVHDETGERFFPNGIGYFYISVQGADDVSVEIEVADLDYNTEEEEDDDDDFDPNDYLDFDDLDLDDDEDEDEAEEGK